MPIFTYIPENKEILFKLIIKAAMMKEDDPIFTYFDNKNSQEKMQSFQTETDILSGDDP